jgi:hypothetical protein
MKRIFRRIIVGVAAVLLMSSAMARAAGSATLIDFDGDGLSDIGVYRNGVWFIRRSSDGGMTSVDWGIAHDMPVPADYDGDKQTDIAVYRDGTWFILRSSDGGMTVVAWGIAHDVPVPADYDGDGKADIAVYRSGDWFILRSSDGGVTSLGWGIAQDIPVPADFDGDRKADIAVYRSGDWFILRSSDGGVTSLGWGIAQDIPVPADFDGDRKADIAVYRSGDWFILRSSDGGVTSLGWGIAQDIPVPADFDGDRKTDIAVYRDGTWFIVRSSNGGVTATGWGGAPEDIPLNGNTLQFTVPDIIVVAAGTQGYMAGTVVIPYWDPRMGAFAAAATNLGASASITVSGDTGGNAALPMTITICQSDPATGACLAAPTSTVTLTIDTNATPTFNIFVEDNSVPNPSGAGRFDPEVDRIYLRFRDQEGIVRGSTSVAVLVLGAWDY